MVAAESDDATASLAVVLSSSTVIPALSGVCLLQELSNSLMAHYQAYCHSDSSYATALVVEPLLERSAASWPVSAFCPVIVIWNSSSLSGDAAMLKTF